MRLLPSLAVVVLVTSACPSLLAPPATSGEPAGSTCASDVECAAGLACECGLCAEPTGEPPRCPDVGDACGETPSECVRACGDPTVVGPATCLGGRESCSATGGLLRSQCPADTCWEAPGPGEVCVDGELRCEDPAPSGECYTSDCEGAPGGCVPACGDGSDPAPQVCIASEWRCESGVPVESCGACVGAVPGCVLTCAALEPVGSAACGASREWSCAHIVQGGAPAEVVTDCCDENPAACPDGGPAPDDGGDGGDEDDGGALEPDSGAVDGGAVDGGDAAPVDGGSLDADAGDAG